MKTKKQYHNSLVLVGELCNSNQLMCRPGSFVNNTTNNGETSFYQNKKKWLPHSLPSNELGKLKLPSLDLKEVRHL